MSPTKLHHEYDPPGDAGIDCRYYTNSDGVVSDCPSLTKQADKDACDINLILERALRNGGILDAPTKPPPFYGDFSDPIDYQAAQEIILQARSHFDSLDARIRDRFANDPLQLLRFVENPENLEEAIRLGLASKTIQPATPAPTEPVVIPPGTVRTETLETTPPSPARPSKT